MEHSTETTQESERYELGDFIPDLGPDSELVFKVIGVVITLLLLGLALAYPWLVAGR